MDEAKIRRVMEWVNANALPRDFVGVDEIREIASEYLGVKHPDVRVERHEHGYHVSIDESVKPLAEDVKLGYLTDDPFTAQRVADAVGRLIDARKADAEILASRKARIEELAPADVILREMVEEHPELKGQPEHWPGFYADWNEVIDACQRAWKVPQSYGESPTELIALIIDERDAAIERAEKAENGS